MRQLKEVVRMLETGKPLDEKYHDHELVNNYAGSRECHIRPDWLLIYWKDRGEEQVRLDLDVLVLPGQHFRSLRLHGSGI